jgi:hypothetical protein
MTFVAEFGIRRPPLETEVLHRSATPKRGLHTINQAPMPHAANW